MSIRALGLSLFTLPLACSEPAPVAKAPAPRLDPISAAPVAPAAPAATPPATKPAVPSSTPGNELTMKTLSLLRTETGNLFISGASVRAALGMAALGARGTSLDEMSKALDVSKDPAENVARAKKETASARAGGGKADLVIANRLWVDRAVPIELAFTRQASEGYGAPAESVDFARAPEPARLEINKWVSDQTKAKIPELLPSGSITDVTRLVLTNAVYFKGSWVDAFKKEQTKDESFQAPSGPVTTPMMHRTGSMAYADTVEVSLVELPYKDSDLAFLVALPKQADQLDRIEADISGGKVDAWAKSLAPARVALSVPKFTFSWGRSIKPELEQLGIKAAFSPQADFSGISTKAGKGLALSDVFHKTFVLVDEVGTEAAAATGGAVTLTSMETETVMTVDHPFLFFVRNKKSGDVLFAGRVTNPKR